MPFADEDVDVPQAYLRADIARRYGELFALGWLGRAFLFAPPIFEKLLPAVYNFEAFDIDLILATLLGFPVFSWHCFPQT